MFNERLPRSWDSSAADPQLVHDYTRQMTVGEMIEISENDSDNSHEEVDDEFFNTDQCIICLSEYGEK